MGPLHCSEGKKDHHFAHTQQPCITSIRWHMTWQALYSRKGEIIKQKTSQRINYIELICPGES